jgi:glycosyltransferase involved in cell wall biosynthesis
MRIAYVTSYDSADINNWSGLGYFIWKSLADRGHEVTLIGSLTVPARVQRMGAFKAKFYSRWLNKMYLAEHDLMTARSYAREVHRRLNQLSGIDVVLSPGTIPVAFLPEGLPVVTCADATHRRLFGTYPAYRNLSRLNHRHGDRIEQAAYRRAAAMVFASQWAADSAIEDYAADPAKVHVVPFGANQKNSPARTFVEQAIAGRDHRRLRLLFIGVEWERKGGPVALEVARHFNEAGLPTHLTIFGCNPEIKSTDREFVTVHGFVSKGGDGQHRIQEEMARSHFLIVPSTAECYGLVYCEASSLGVPSVARNVGGVATIVQNDRNGRLFNPQESPVVIAEWIGSIFRDYDAYRRLALSSFEEYEARLNWKVAGERLEKILENAVHPAKT